MKVLVVEDEPAISRIICRKLRSMGYECRAVESIIEAKKRIGEDRPEIAFLDYILVDGRSKELAVGGYLNNVRKIFVMSAFMDDLDKNDFDGLNVTFLKKPFSDLMGVLETLAL